MKQIGRDAKYVCKRMGCASVYLASMLAIDHSSDGLRTRLGVSALSEDIVKSVELLDTCVSVVSVLVDDVEIIHFGQASAKCSNSVSMVLEFRRVFRLHVVA